VVASCRIASIEIVAKLHGHAVDRVIGLRKLEDKGRE
jgi:hypothetical protein